MDRARESADGREPVGPGDRSKGGHRGRLTSGYSKRFVQHFVTKKGGMETTQSRLGSVMEKLSRASSIEEDRAEDKFEAIIGNSPALKSALAEVERVAPTDSTVLVLGETGTGKELIAHAIHN